MPEPFSWLQDAVDADPRPRRFVFTGSQQFGLRQELSQSLAGRVALLELLPSVPANWPAAAACQPASTSCC